MIRHDESTEKASNESRALKIGPLESCCREGFPGRSKQRVQQVRQSKRPEQQRRVGNQELHAQVLSFLPDEPEGGGIVEEPDGSARRMGEE